jgi:hypothetical protein
MAVCVLLPEATRWLDRQEETELPQLRPLPFRKTKAALHPIILKEREFCEERIQRDRERADPRNHFKHCAWCCIFRSVYPSSPRT